MTQTKHVPIVVAEGDGIGPEIMGATLDILEASSASLDIKKVEIGEKVYLKGYPAGIKPDTWDAIREAEGFLKAPITTPQGGGFKSLNVTIRTTLGLYANVRPCVTYAPFVDTKHPSMDVVVIRENEEDLYTGIEYQQTPDVCQALKLITRTGCERIIHYAFEYARTFNRKKVTCFTKDNILKLSDGLFHKVFDEIAKDYPDIENEHWIIDIGAAKLADSPHVFDVVVMPNLYGDILSDIAAQIAGSVGLAGSANIGDHAAMFEAIHGSAPRRAGKNLANPSGLIMASVMMLAHIGQTDAAAEVHNAWLKTIEDGIHTYDIYKHGESTEQVGTKEFGKAVIDRIGQKPEQLNAVCYQDSPRQSFKSKGRGDHSKLYKSKDLVGIDIFVQAETAPEDLQKLLNSVSNNGLNLTLIANRGVRVWPHTMPETTCVDHWRCRFMSAKKKGDTITQKEAIELLGDLADKNVEIVKTENLYNFDGKPAYSVGQDEQ